MIYTALVGVVVLTALVASSRRDRGARWRPWATACGVSLVAACALALGGCPPWDRPACGSPRSWSCVGDQPHVCSPSGRLTPVGDETCARAGATCALSDAGVAFCAPVDGGAR